MNKLFTKIAALALGAAMVVGVGVSVGSKSNIGEAKAEDADINLTETTTGESYEGTNFVVSGGLASSGYFKLGNGTLTSANTYNIDSSKTISYKIKTRKFGGPSSAQAKVDLFVKNGSTELATASYSPTSTSLTYYTGTFTVKSGDFSSVKFVVSGNGESNASKGVGISEIQFTAFSGSGPTPTSYTTTVDITGGAKSTKNTSTSFTSSTTSGYVYLTPSEGYEIPADLDNAFSIASNATLGTVTDNGDGDVKLAISAVQGNFTITGAFDESSSSGSSGTIVFGNNDTKINSTSVSGNDDNGVEWTIQTVGTNSFTQNAAYSQVGSSSKPATSITFTASLDTEYSITSFSAKFGGFSSTAGTVNLFVDDVSVGSGSLNGTTDVTITADQLPADGTDLKITVTNIAKGVKVYNIAYEYSTSSEKSIEVDSVVIKEGDTVLSGTVNKGTVEKHDKMNVSAVITYVSGEGYAPGSSTPVWDSSDKTVAEITESGVIEFLSQGETTITAKSSNADNKDTVFGSFTLKLESVTNVDVTTITVKSGLTTGNMTGGDDFATYFDSSDSSVWSIVGHKGMNSNFPGINSKQYVALYWAATQTNSVDLSSPTGALIKSVSFVFTGETYSNIVVKVGGNVVSPTNDAYVINSTAFEISNGNSSNVQVQVKSIQIKYDASSAVAISSITNPTLSVSSASLSDVVVPTFSVTVTGAGGKTPTELIKWSSSDETVAYLTETNTLGVASIMLVGEGTCTFSAKNQTGSISSTSATFTVTAAQLFNSYDVSFVGSAGADGSELNVDTVGAQFPAGTGGKNINVSAISKIYPSKDNSWKFGTSSANGSFTFKVSGQQNIQRVVVCARAWENTQGTLDSATISVTVGESTQTSSTLTDAFEYLVYDFESPNSTVVISSSSRLWLKNVVAIVENKSAEIGAYGYAADFLNATAEECASEAVTSATWNSLASKWTTMKSTYSGSDDYFAAQQPDAEGTSVQNTLARYSFIIHKPAYSNYSNFMTNSSDQPIFGRSISPIQNLVEGNGTKVIIIIVSVIGVSALGGFFFLRKRKEI